jgi:DNA mismatch repair ATPase MutS
MILHYRNRLTLSSYLHSVPQFFKLVFIARKLSSETLFNTICPDIKNRLQSIQQLVRFLSYFKYDDKIENDMAVLLLAIKELVSIFFLVEPNVLFRSFRLLEEKKADIECFFAYEGHIDMLQSVARMQEDFPYYCKPQWTEEGLQTTDIYHPLIEHCIPNTLNTNGKSVLLTGSNMSGKTTFIRTIALNMLSANTLDMCFARSFSGRRMKIHSAINLHDNLLESQSFYMKEIIVVKDMLEKTHQSGYNLFILDEIYKGTNTLERIAASKAVLSALAVNGNMVFVSTHDIELADLLAEEYDLYHFCEQIEHNQLYFDYLIKRGKLKNRNAIRLLEINGYPESVVSEAISITEKL